MVENCAGAHVITHHLTTGPGGVHDAGAAWHSTLLYHTPLTCTLYWWSEPHRDITPHYWMHRYGLFVLSITCSPHRVSISTPPSHPIQKQQPSRLCTLKAAAKGCLSSWKQWGKPLNQCFSGICYWLFLLLSWNRFHLCNVEVIEHALALLQSCSHYCESSQLSSFVQYVPLILRVFLVCCGVWYYTTTFVSFCRWHLWGTCLKEGCWCPVLCPNWVCSTRGTVLMYHSVRYSYTVAEVIFNHMASLLMLRTYLPWLELSPVNWPVFRRFSACPCYHPLGTIHFEPIYTQSTLVTAFT